VNAPYYALHIVDMKEMVPL